MTDHDDDHHGQSLAAWVMVGIVLVAGAIMAVAFIFPNIPLIIGSVILMIVGLVVGKVLALAGHGVDGAISRRDVNLS
ncbi:MAG: DUF6704 family protein [Knoellia sp.]